MPTKEVLDYYNEHLKGEDGLHSFIPATKISNEIDAFVNLDPIEICKHSLFNQEADIVNKVKGHISFGINDESYIRLRTKFVCASVYQQLCIITKYQNEIEAHRPKRNPLMNNYSLMAEEMSYNQVPDEYYRNLCIAVDSSHMAFERYKKMSISEDFRNGVFKLATGNVSNYWPIFGLDYTPVSQKIEDKAIGCGAQIFLAAIGIFIFWLIAYFATH